jgi:hypothetical protein
MPVAARYAAADSALQRRRPVNTSFNLFLVLLAALVALVIVRRVRQFMSAMVPPLRIHLVPVSASHRHAGDVKRFARPLQAHGFTRIGTFRADPMQRVFLTAFAHSGHSMCAVVYTHPLTATFMDIISMNETGRSFTITTAPTGRELDQREGHEKVFESDMPVEKMIETVLKRRPPEPHVTWNATSFVTKFEQAYAEEMDWRASRGGVTQEEVRRAADATGRTFSDYDIQKATHRLQRRYSAARRNMR